MAKYTFGEVRKVVTAAAGLAVSVAGYIAADATLREIVPPQWIAFVLALGGVFAVFKVPNDKSVEIREVAVEVPVPAPPMTPVDMINGAVQGAQSTAQGVADGIGKLKDIIGVVPGLIALTPDMPGELDDLAKGWLAGLGKKP